MGADVAVLDRNPEALRRVDAVLGNRVRTLFSTRDVVELLCPRADLVIATVLVPGSTTPKLITAQGARWWWRGHPLLDQPAHCGETSAVNASNSSIRWAALILMTHSARNVIEDLSQTVAQFHFETFDLVLAHVFARALG